MKNEIIVDGVVYTKKNEVVDNYVIIRTINAGVFAGELEKKEGNEVTLKNSRRIWYWSGAASLSELAMKGVANPDKCKFACEVTEITLLEVIEIIKCTKEAQECIKNVYVWTAHN